MKFIVVPNFYIINEQANPPLQFEPFYNYGDFEIVHLKRGQKLETIPDDDFYGITAYTEDYPMAEIVAKFLKHRNPECRIAIGGCHATYSNNDINRSLFDDVIVGNGEYFISQLFQRGNILHSLEPCSQNIKWDSRSFKHFVKYNPNYHRGSNHSYPIRTSFGCYWNCHFCANKKWGRQVHYRDVVEIEKQLEYLLDNNVTNIRVIDEIFTSHPQFETICKMLKSFTWNAQDRIDQLTEKKCKTLSENGCNLVQVGIESFDERIRQQLNKCLMDESIEIGIKCAKENGIKLNAFMMLGTPYDTVESINYTCDEGIRLFGYENLRPDIFIPYLGTRIGDNPRKYNLRILETGPGYYSTFCFQNTHGKLVSVPKHITDVTSWEKFLWHKLYELAPKKVKNVLDNPITDWYTDELYNLQQ